MPRTGVGRRWAQGTPRLLGAAGVLLVEGAILVLGTLPAVVARLGLRLPWSAPRALCRLVLVGAAYLALFEMPAVWAVAWMRTAGEPTPEGYRSLAARLSSRLFDRGLPFAGMRVIRRGVPPIVDGVPVVVLARHAGVLNAPLLLYALSHDLGGRRLRGCGKRLVALVPGLAGLLRGLGVVLLPWNLSGRITALRMWSTMAADVGPDDAVLVFPEGANYTRRRRALAMAGRTGGGARHRDVLHRTLPPRSAGALAVVRAAPAADVVVFGHTGLEDLLPWCAALDYPRRDHGELHLTWWQAHADQVPRTAAPFDGWLTDRWFALDRWIGRVREESDGDQPSECDREAVT